MDAADADAAEVGVERRRLFWVRVPDRLVDTTVYGTLSVRIEEVSAAASAAVEAMVTEHFVRAKEKRMLTEAERVGQEVGAIGGVLKEGSLTFLDQRRFNNLAIALTRLGLPNATLREAVLAGDERVLTPEVVELLVPCAPTADDIEAIAPYDGDPALLAQVERFFWEVHKVPHFTNRLLALRAKQTYAAQAAHAQRLLEQVNCACSAVLVSDAFEVLLALVLAAGNAINRGTARGGVRGYKLDVLVKLADVKSMAGGAKGRGATLLRLLVELAERALPESAARWTEDLECVGPASRISWDRITSELAQMKASIELCQRVHKAVKAKAKDSAAVDAFGATIGQWLEGAQRTLGMQQESLRSTQRLFRAVAQRLGEDASGGVGPETLFSLLERFRHQWCGASAALADASQQAAREVGRAQRKAERAAVIEAKRAAAHAAAAASAAALGDGDISSVRPGVPGQRTAVGKLHIRLSTNKRCTKAGVRVARATGGGKACVTCGAAFVGWGRTCAPCRKPGPYGARDGAIGATGGGGGGGGSAGDGAKGDASKFQSAEGIEHCFVCAKRCYPAERFVVGGRVFHRKSPGHRGCFRCTQCDAPLNEANFSNAGDKMYCNTHFRQLFATTGDYRFALGDAGRLGATGGAAVAATATTAATADTATGMAVVRNALETVVSGPSQRLPELVPSRDSFFELREPSELLSSLATSLAPTEPSVAAPRATATGGGAAAAPEEEEEEEEEDGVEATHYVYGDLRIPIAIETAWMRVRDHEHPNNWLLVGPSTHDANQVELIGEGAGGLSECRQRLVECGGATRVVYGGLRLVAVDTRRGIRSERPKFVFVMATGADVPIRAATRGMLERGAIAEVLQQTHISFEVEGVDELTAQTIAAKLLHSGGAHKPNAFDFGGGQVLEEEWY